MRVTGVNAKMPGFMVVVLRRVLACGSKDRAGNRGNMATFAIGDSD